MPQAKKGTHAYRAAQALRPVPKGIKGIWAECRACEFLTFQVFTEDDGEHWCRECNPSLTAGAEALEVLVGERII